MKIKKKNSDKGVFSQPAKNKSKKNTLVILVVLVTVGLILWVYSMGRQAEQTVRVCMLSQDVYKNEVITDDMLQPYDMIKAEYQKYAIVDNGGTKERRVILWSEKDKIINSFAAYPLQQGTYAEYRSFIKSRVDNSDNVLYSFPGKEIIPLEIGSQDLSAFKTFLQPGDTLNLEAIFSDEQTVSAADGYGGTTTEKQSVFKTETVFKDIMMADLLNSDGQSILDIYSKYNNATVYEQAQLDNSDSFKKSTEPKTLLVALTPAEKERYYYYLSKSDVTFRVSMPQRSN